MTVRYVLTSACIAQGTMTLTHSLRQHLMGRERVVLVDEDGEAHELEVDWKGGVVRGLGPYYEKRRLQANEVLLLHFRGEEVEVQVVTRDRRSPLPKPTPPKGDPPPRPSQEGREGTRRVRVTPYPKDPLPYPSKGPPEATEDLRRLGFRLEDGPPWLYRSEFGRRQVLLALLRPGEGEVDLLKPYQARGAYVALLAPEAKREEVQGVGFVSPEALARLAQLRGRFPITPLDVERLLKEGRVDMERVEALEGELLAELSERGELAAFLLFLAQRPVGGVFLLADLEAEALEEGLAPSVVRQGVEILSRPPFLLLKRLAPGEFVLRRGVGEALRDLEAFAQGLLARLSRVHADV